jgi:hypothetical protein
MAATPGRLFLDGPAHGWQMFAEAQGRRLLALSKSVAAVRPTRLRPGRRDRGNSGRASAPREECRADALRERLQDIVLVGLPVRQER